MAAPFWMGALARLRLSTSIPIYSVRCICTSNVQNKNIRAGKYKITNNRSKVLTYEEAQPPEYIGVRKTWNSWNTKSAYYGKGSNSKEYGNLHEETTETGETTWEDEFIRKLVKGTWPNLFKSEVIIKRRHNRIIVAGLVVQALAPQKMYFLLGYTEELLSQLFKRPVTMEIQTVKDKRDMDFKFI